MPLYTVPGIFMDMNKIPRMVENKIGILPKISNKLDMVAAKLPVGLRLPVGLPELPTMGNGSSPTAETTPASAAVGATYVSGVQITPVGAPTAPTSRGPLVPLLFE